ncbi:MAG TPA: LysM peptidoglycan-binding domain-containing protein, partial [Thermoanaerobaculia bacterium]|nr:LysM peptidoglycan-binding domain-containing protein [Thermoanaerobaculia bacterium]
VVTSLVRPRNRQPANASPLSVHPTGMAMDLRISSSWSCRSWLERRLIELERQGVLEAARERRPPHYHLVLFPRQYLDGIAVEAVALAAVSGGGSVSYQVRHGDSLWGIARRHGTTVSLLREANGLSSDRLRPGQVLAIPAR